MGKEIYQEENISPPQAISAQTTRPIPVTETKNENEKIMLSPCNCKEKCKDKVRNSDRIKIHRAYWDKNYTERRTWLLKQIDTTSVKRRKTQESEDSVPRRGESRTYNFKELPELIRVCKTMFMATLGYKSDKFITVALKSLSTDDMRGHHDHSYHSLKEEDKTFIEKHILSYEPGISHYRRGHAPHCLYVDPSLTISDMFQAYQKACREENRQDRCISVYTKKLHKMNISFAKLGHEECEVCMKNEEHKKEVGENEHDCADCKKHIEHIQRDKLCRGCYKEDKKAQDDGSNDTLYVSLDLQKVRMLPEIPGSRLQFLPREFAHIMRVLSRSEKEKD